jgi:hypothetical protein
MSENHNNNAVVWVDIPVVDLLRAADFYYAVLDREIDITEFEEFTFATIEHTNGSGGCLYPDSDYVPSDSGPLVYFSVEGRLADAVSQCKKLGGEVIQDTHQIGNFGMRAVIKDSEGNRIALHSTTGS